MTPSQREWWLAGPLALAVLLASTATAAARGLPDPCFLCMEQPTCAYPEPVDGTAYSLIIPSAAPPPERPAGAAPTLLDELAGKALLFTLKYKEKAFVEVDGRLISLGRYNPETSTDIFHVFDGTRPASATRGSLRAIVELRCKENIRVDKLLRVSASFDEVQEGSSKPKRSALQPPANITFRYIIPTNRACGLPVCASKGGVLPPGEYLVYKPPLLRQECPGAFLSAPSCKSGHDALQLFPLGQQLSERQQWRITAAAAAGGTAPGADAAGYEEAGYEEDEEEIDLVGQPVLIQNVERSARMCASHLSGGGPGGCGTTGSGVTVAHAAEQWVFEPGPLGPSRAMVHQFYIRAKSLADAGCERSYLCLELTCGATNLQLCSKVDRQYSTLWNVRPTDISGVLMRSWGMA